MVCLGWQRVAVVDWSADSPWSLQEPLAGARYRLGQRVEELNLAPDKANQEMTVLDTGVLLRQRDGWLVNLTVLQGAWKLCCGDAVVGVVGTRLAEWEASLGPPVARYANPQKVGVMHYYRAALADIALLVANGEVHSVMLVEPGRLVPALERTGYTPLPVSL